MKSLKIAALFIMTIYSLFCTAQVKTDSVINVGVIVYEDMELQDFAGPTNVFVKAREATFGQYEIYTIGLTKEPIRTESGVVTIIPTYTVHDMPKSDIVVIPGADIEEVDSLRQNLAFIKNLNKVIEVSTVVMSVSSGSYLLAATGALENLSSTTHFFLADDFQQLYPLTKVVKNVRYVDEDNRITTSGITSGIDGALHLVNKYSGEKTAILIAKALQYEPHEKQKWPIIEGKKYERSN